MILLMQILRLLNVILLSCDICDLLCWFFVVLPFIGILTDSSLGKRGPSRD